VVSAFLAKCKKKKHMTPRLSDCPKPQSCAFMLKEEKVIAKITLWEKGGFKMFVIL
jgi:hypothetical protein